MKFYNKIFVMVLFGVALGPPRILAASVDSAASNATEKYVIKLNVECGTNLSIEYDTESMKKNNKDIGWGQTDGGNQCNEPLRYLWYACKSPAGKTAAKKITKIICKGVAGKTGKLSKSGGTITVERAYEESKSFSRNLKQFNAAMGLTIKPKDEDPYHDSDWDGFGRKENPVTDTKSYCLVDGQKKKFDAGSSIYSSFEYQKGSGTAKCWKDGKQILDLTFKAGKKTGFLTNSRDDWYSVESYKDGLREGESKSYEKGKIKSAAMYQKDQQVWDKDFYPNGKLKSYDRKMPNGYARVSFHENAKIDNVECKPEVKGDTLLEKICGFGKPSSIKTYDSSGKVKNVFVFKNGVMQSRSTGDSEQGVKSEVKFSGGKQNGPEKVMGKNGKLAAVIQWKEGQKNGPEKIFHTDGKKIVKLINWKKDEMADVTEFYLNGNPKIKEVFASEKQKTVQHFYDSGKVSDEGKFVRCQGRWSNRWCEDGVHKSYSETGKISQELTFKEGKRSGTQKSWYDNGKPWRVEEYVDDKIRSGRYYDKNGSLKEAVEYEEDGSKKVKKK